MLRFQLLVIVSGCLTGLSSASICCTSKWGDESACGDYVRSGGLCNTDWATTCNSNSDCPEFPAPQTVPTPAPPLSQVLLVGLYNRSGPSSVLSYSFDGSPSVLPLSSFSAGAGVSWITSSRKTSVANSDVGGLASVFAVNEFWGTVVSLSLDCNGKMAETSRVSSGPGPVFLATDPMSDYLLSADYWTGVAVMPVSWSDGIATLGAVSQTLKFAANSLTHSVYFAPGCTVDGCAVFVPTKGLDEVQQLFFRDGKLSKAHEPFSVPTHQLPRHMAFHPSLPIVVLVNEGSQTANVTIELLGYNKETGLSWIATYSASGPYSAPNLFPGEVLFTKQGHFALVTVRDGTAQKRDGVAVFKVEENGQSLSLVDYATVGQKNPRSMALADTGLLIVANSDGNSLSFFNLDFATGKLTKAKEDLHIGDSPAFVGIFELADGCNRKTSTVLV